MLTVLIFHGALLSALLVVFGRNVHRSNLWLGALIAVATLLLLEAWLRWSGTVVAWPHLIGVFQPLWFAIGPLAYVYACAFVGRPLRRVHIALFLPMVGVIFWMLPFLVLPAETKLRSRLDLSAMLHLYTVFWITTAACAYLARRLLRSGLAERSPHGRTPWRIGWLQFLMGVLIAYAAIDLAATIALLLSGSYPPIVGVLSLLILVGIVYAVGILVLLPDGLLARSPWPGQQYSRARLPQSTADELVTRLEQQMRDARPWLDDDLDLARLAGQLGISPHQMSQLLSQHLNTSFAAYVNRFRINEAKRLLIDMSSRKSILDVGLESGFGSSASFYRAFKQQVGMTPKEFLKATVSTDVRHLSKG